MRTLIISLLFLLQASSLSAQETKSFRIHNGIITAEEYIRLTTSEQTLWMAGYMDAIFISTVYGMDYETMNNISSCVEEKTANQLAAILNKEIETNPESWHQGAHLRAYMMLSNLCDIKFKQGM